MKCYQIHKNVENMTKAAEDTDQGKELALTISILISMISLNTSILNNSKTISLISLNTILNNSKMISWAYIDKGDATKKADASKALEKPWTNKHWRVLFWRIILLLRAK